MALGFDKRATATILAALRLFQRDIENNQYDDEYPEFFDDFPPLTSDQIDDLCNEINLARLKGAPR